VASDPEALLAAEIATLTHDPLQYAETAFPWGQGVLRDATGPRVWQRGILNTIGIHLRSEHRFEPLRIAVASGHGVGKSALISMIAKWALDTCDDCRVVITANTEPQVRTKTWPELTKWQNLSITRDWFKATAMSLISTQPDHDKAWRADAVTWSINNTEAFAGLHNQGKRIVIIYDEASGIDDKVWEVTQGALTDEQTEIIWIAFGNPTQSTGRFRDCFGKYRSLWKTAQLDSRTVEGTNKAYLDELVRTYGEDHDIVRVRVRGIFPKSASTQFIASDVVAGARVRPTQYVVGDPIIYGVDTARFGDDESVLAVRQGRDARSVKWQRWQGATSTKIAGDIALYAKSYPPDAVFVDAGGPNAGGVIDTLRALGVDNVFEISFGAAGREAAWDQTARIRTANKRAEMWANMRAWLVGGCIPDDERLAEELVGIEYGYAGDQMSLLLEKKEHMKDRIGSPDNADALALTFAEPVMPKLKQLEDEMEMQSYDRYAGLRS
jgi:hypothetical protein